MNSEWQLIESAMELLLEKGYDAACEAQPDLQPLLEALCEELGTKFAWAEKWKAVGMGIDLKEPLARAGDILEARRRAETGEEPERATKED
jgi:hypothetical protein